MRKVLSSKDWELISSYLDDELTPREKVRVEERLNTRSEYREALEGLQRTKAILHKAPVHKVPRNFTLTAAMVPPLKAPRWTFTMQWSSAVAALVAVFMFAYQLVPGLSTGAMRTASEEAANEPSLNAMEMAAPAAAAEADGSPNIIYWGGPPAPITAYGKGGGGGCGAPGDMCGGAADSGPIGGGSDTIPTQFLQTPVPNPLPDLQTGPLITPAPTQPVTGTGPVLGVRPTDEQGKVFEDTATDQARGIDAESRSFAQKPWILGAAGGLLALAIGAFITAILARRNALR